MGSLEIGMVLSDAGGALRVTGVGPTEFPVAGCQRHWCGAPEAPVWDPESPMMWASGDTGFSEVAV